MIKSKFRYFLFVSIAIVTFDVIGSFASKIIQFDYTDLLWVSLFLYALAGYFGCKFFNLYTGIFAGFVAGFIDSTIGSAVSIIINPFLPFEPIPHTFPTYVLMMIIVLIMGLLLGIIGSFICFIFKRN